MSFEPEGTLPNATTNSNLKLLHGVLPHEVVCTENLTPFLKLLPCKGKAGISSLLDGHKLFDASWQSMAIDVRPLCPEDGGECVLEIEQTVDMVLDIDRSKRPRGTFLPGNSTVASILHTLLTSVCVLDNPIPRPRPHHELKCDTTKPYHAEGGCFPLDHALGQEWTLSQIFGKPLKGTCPLTNPDTSPVCMEVPNSRHVFTSVGAREIKSSQGNSRCYELDADADFDIILPPLNNGEGLDGPEEDFVKPATPLIYADRSFMGYGQERGAVQTILRNPSPDTEVEFVYMESLPWFMRVYVHTLDARIDGVSGSQRSLIKEIYYRPAVDRARGTQLELRMVLPPSSTVFLSYDFEKSILRYTEYPPDANRGFDVAAAIITTVSPRRLNLRTTSLLLNLPTPDFSMPYNVIIFTSTAIALAFGGLYNILVRRFVGVDEAPKPPLRRKIGALVERVKGLVRAKRGKEGNGKG